MPRAAIIMLLATLISDAVYAQDAARALCYERCQVALQQRRLECVRSYGSCFLACLRNNRDACSESCRTTLSSCLPDNERNGRTCVASCETAFPLNNVGT